MAPRDPSNTQRAVEDLRALIFSGDLAPDSDHLESELAERLGMSRTPVREAVLTLSAQGLLEVRPRRGVRVAAISPADMDEIYEVLTELESLAAARAAEARPDADALADLRTALEAMETALATGDRDAWAMADGAFHGELVRLGGNRRVAGIVATMVDQVRRARAMTLHLRPLPLRSNEDHRAVYDAIARGDAGAARARHHAHRTEARAALTGILRDHRLRRV
jgi:DNA-binding GntR family transcriptional regulator